MSRKNNTNNMKPGGELKAIEKIIVSNQKKRQPQSKKRAQGRNNAFSNSSAAPSAVSDKFTTRQPKISRQGDITIINHTELALVVIANSTTSFAQAGRLRMNPGSVGTFPWLSATAVNFEHYRFRKLKLIFKSRVPTTTAGSLIIAPDYDSQDGVPTLEKLMTSLKDTVEDVPWKTLICTLDPRSMNRAYKNHFTMSDSRFATTTQDEKTIDAAQVFVAFDNLGGVLNQTWGKLFVEYEVELHTPQTPVLSFDVGGLRDVGNSTQIGAQPFVNASTITQDVSNPILKNWATQFPGGFPTGNYGIFTRDWQGDVLTQVGGTVLTGLTAPVLTQNGVNVPVVTSQTNTLINAAATVMNRMDNVKAFAGDYIGLGTVSGATISAGGLNTLFGGSSIL